jgi:hypothetical protein
MKAYGFIPLLTPLKSRWTIPLSHSFIDIHLYVSLYVNWLYIFKQVLWIIDMLQCDEALYNKNYVGNTKPLTFRLAKEKSYKSWHTSKFMMIMIICILCVFTLGRNLLITKHIACLYIRTQRFLKLKMSHVRNFG